MVAGPQPSELTTGPHRYAVLFLFRRDPTLLPPRNAASCCRAGGSSESPIRAFSIPSVPFLKSEQRRDDAIELVSSSMDFDKIASAQDTRWVSELETAIAVDDEEDEGDEED